MDVSGTNKRNPSDDDFSTSVRKKLSLSTRTGQACDRCKVRKIKCDGNPDGCAPCQQAQLICKTTDRNNGRTTVRGHSDRLEWEVRFLQDKVAELERRLRDNGLPVDDAAQQGQSSFAYASDGPSRSSRSSWDQMAAQSAGKSQQYADTPAEGDADCLSAPHQSLSILKGTTLSLFGMQIDVAKFTREHDDPESPTGYETFLKYTFGKARVDSIPLLPPNLEDAQGFAIMYLRSLNIFTPILHKPDFFHVLARRYDGQALSPAEEVMIHMSFGEMKYQIALRNGQRQMMETAFAHYKYCLGFFHDLLLSRQLPDLQALLLIAVKQRNFPKPGAAWQCSQLALSLAVELNLHRSANSLPEEERSRLTYHDKEMRKRIFWIAYTLSIALSMKLGLPIRLRLDDLDIEFPEPEPDELLDEPGSCSFHVGIAAIQNLEITGRMISALFGPRRSQRVYAEQVTNFENEIVEWRRSLRPELRDFRRASKEGKVQALFIEFWQIETLFFLRHPVIHSSSDPKLNAENSRIILNLASDLLTVVSEMQKLHATDVPWINITVFLAAIFTTLFIYEQRTEEISVQELQKLESDMSLWLVNLQEIGLILGTGNSLSESTKFVVDKALERIRRQVSASDAAEVAARALSQSSIPPSRQPSSSGPYANVPSYQPPNHSASNSSTVKIETSQAEYAPPPSNGLPTSQASYAPSSHTSQYSYTDPSVNNPPTFSNAQAYQQTRYPIPEGSQLQNTMQSQPSQPTQGALNPVYSMSDGQIYYATQSSMSNDWLRWGHSSLAFPSVTQEYAGSATALVELGGRPVSTHDAIQTAPPVTDMSAWPMNFLGQQNGTGGA